MLTSSEKKAFKAKAHALQPVILIGHKGLTTQVLQEISLALEQHELIKIRVQVGDKILRETTALNIAEHLHAEYIAHIGRVLIVYRKQQEG